MIKSQENEAMKNHSFFLRHSSSLGSCSFPSWFSFPDERERCPRRAACEHSNDSEFTPWRTHTGFPPLGARCAVGIARTSHEGLLHARAAQTSIALPLLNSLFPSIDVCLRKQGTERANRGETHQESMEGQRGGGKEHGRGKERRMMSQCRAPSELNKREKHSLPLTLWRAPSTDRPNVRVEKRREEQEGDEGDAGGTRMRQTRPPPTQQEACSRGPPTNNELSLLPLRLPVLLLLGRLWALFSSCSSLSPRPFSATPLPTAFPLPFSHPLFPLARPRRSFKAHKLMAVTNVRLRPNGLVVHTFLPPTDCATEQVDERARVVGTKVLSILQLIKVFVTSNFRSLPRPILDFDVLFPLSR